MFKIRKVKENSMDSRQNLQQLPSPKYQPNSLLKSDFRIDLKDEQNDTQIQKNCAQKQSHKRNNTETSTSHLLTTKRNPHNRIQLSQLFTETDKVQSSRREILDSKQATENSTRKPSNNNNNYNTYIIQKHRKQNSENNLTKLPYLSPQPTSKIVSPGKYNINLDRITTKQGVPSNINHFSPDGSNNIINLSSHINSKNNIQKKINYNTFAIKRQPNIQKQNKVYNEKYYQQLLAKYSDEAQVSEHPVKNRVSPGLFLRQANNIPKFLRDKQYVPNISIQKKDHNQQKSLSYIQRKIQNSVLVSPKAKQPQLQAIDYYLPLQKKYQEELKLQSQQQSQNNSVQKKQQSQIKNIQSKSQSLANLSTAQNISTQKLSQEQQQKQEKKPLQSIEQQPLIQQKEEEKEEQNNNSPKQKKPAPEPIKIPPRNSKISRSPREKSQFHSPQKKRHQSQIYSSSQLIHSPTRSPDKRKMSIVKIENSSLLNNLKQVSYQNHLFSEKDDSVESVNNSSFDESERLIEQSPTKKPKRNSMQPAEPLSKMFKRPSIQIIYKNKSQVEEPKKKFRMSYDFSNFYNITNEDQKVHIQKKTGIYEYKKSIKRVDSGLNSPEKRNSMNSPLKLRSVVQKIINTNKKLKSTGLSPLKALSNVSRSSQNQIEYYNTEENQIKEENDVEEEEDNKIVDKSSSKLQSQTNLTSQNNTSGDDVSIRLSNSKRSVSSSGVALKFYGKNNNNNQSNIKIYKKDNQYFNNTSTQQTQILTEEEEQLLEHNKESFKSQFSNYRHYFQVMIKPEKNN